MSHCSFISLISFRFVSFHSFYFVLSASFSHSSVGSCFSAVFHAFKLFEKKERSERRHLGHENAYIYGAYVCVNCECLCEFMRLCVCVLVCECVRVCVNLHLYAGQSEPCYRHIISWRPCASMSDAEVVNVSSEAELLLAWKEFIVRVCACVCVSLLASAVCVNMSCQRVV